MCYQIGLSRKNTEKRRNQATFLLHMESVANGVQRKRHRGTSRASKACEICRRQKTRCFASSNSKCCLRCQTLGLQCSFLNGEKLELQAPGPPISIESRLETLDSNMAEVLRLLRGGKSSTIYPDSEQGLTPFGQPSLTFLTSPFNLYGSLVRPELFPAPLARLYNPQMVVHDQDIITLGLISHSQALALLEYFKLHYNHWVSFPDDVSTSALLAGMRRRCSLLLTVCCCVSIRHFDANLRVKVYKHLLNRLQTELYQSMLVVPQTIEFMQALTVMCIYASSLSEGEIVIDAWFYSGVALEHFITKDVLGLVMSFDGLEPVTEFDALTAYRVWNHLCLVHLVNCIMSGRPCVLDQARLDLCRRTLELTSSTNFDGRMIAEIILQYHVYLFVQNSKNLDGVEDDLKSWKDEWSYLFEQPTEQFVEMGYHYCYFVILWHWHCGNNRSTFDLSKDSIGRIAEGTFESCSSIVLVRMVVHLLKVIKSLLSVKEDQGFKCLSDQVHFCGVFSATSLARIIPIISQMEDVNDLPESPDIITKNLERLANRFQKNSVTSEDLTYRFGQAILESVAVI